MKLTEYRKLKPCLQQLFASEQAWAIDEAAMSGLFFRLQEGDLDPLSIAHALRMESSEAPAPKVIGNAAVLPIFGVLTRSSTWLTEALGWTTTAKLEADFVAALANPEIKSIVLLVDSPGGMAMGNEEVSRTMFAARGKKPVMAFVNGLCCSAAYYLASAADGLVASPSSTIGSIGAVLTHIEYSKLLSDIGISATVIRSAPNKQLGNPYEKLTAEGKASLQAWISSYGNQFEQAVARHRGITQADVKAKYGQGEQFLADEAQRRGLIEGVGSWQQFIAGVQSGISPSISSALAHLESPVTASGIPAAASAATLPLVPVASAAATNEPPQKDRPMPVSARVRAALFARGIIAAQDADDVACRAAINSFFVARGEACPTDDDKIIAALLTQAPATAAAATPPAAPAAGSGAAPNVAAAHEAEMAEARKQGAKSEQQRQDAVRASAKLLNLGDEEVTAAIASNEPHEKVVAGWHTTLAGKEKPVSGGGSAPRVGQEGIERYVADATTAMILHVGQSVPAAQITPAIRQLSYAPLRVHAQRCLAAANVRFDENDPEEMMIQAFEMDAGRHVIRADGGIAYNRPGSFPNLLSGLANKLLDQGVELAETTYEGYTSRWAGDLPNFNAVPIVAKGMYGELDEVLDQEAFKEQGLAEECLSSLQLGRYGNSFALTPVMAANDDLNAFTEGLIGLSEGWELKKNRGCLSLLTGNVYLLDTYQLYDNTNHGNDLSSGAAPSVTQWDLMQRKLAAQQTIGNKGRVRGKLAVILVAPKNQVAAQQTFEPLGGTVVVESKTPTTDSTLNTFRGKVKVLTEPDLQDSSDDKFYAFCDPANPRNAAIVVAYFRGWGPTGKRERWYEPKNKCYYISLEGRFGCAAKQYRTTVRNAGA